MKYKFYVLTLGVLVLDHVTKWLARDRLDPERAIELIPGYLQDFLREQHRRGFRVIPGP